MADNRDPQYSPDHQAARTRAGLTPGTGTPCAAPKPGQLLGTGPDPDERRWGTLDALNLTNQLRRLREEHTPQVIRLASIVERVIALADALNGGLAGILVPGPELPGPIGRENPGFRELHNTRATRVNLENQVRRAVAVLEIALEDATHGERSTLDSRSGVGAD